MICPSCQEETRGIRINGKVFCSVCGEKIAHPTEEAAVTVDTEKKEKQTPTKQESEDPKPKIITREGEDLNLLNAELTALEMIEEEAIREEEAEEDAFIKDLGKSEKKSKPTKTKAKKTKEKPKIEKRTIVKHNRKRTDLKPKSFMVIEGEPDPITTPELEFPTEMEVTAAKSYKNTSPVTREDGSDRSNEKQHKTEAEMSPKIEIESVQAEFVNEAEKAEQKPNENILEDEVSYPLFGKDKAEELDNKKQKKQQALTQFLQAGVKKPTKSKKKQKKKKKRDRKILTLVAVAFAIIVPIVGLFAYVNLYWANPKVAQKKAEAIVSINFKKPGYIPPGYEIDQQTKASENEIEYHYTYFNNEKRNLSFKITETTKTELEVYSEFVSKEGIEYAEFVEEGQRYWYIDDKKLVFKNDNLLYVISASDKISTDELLKIAEGLI